MIFQIIRGRVTGSARATSSSSAESSFQGKSAYFTRMIVGIWCTFSSMTLRLPVTLS